MESNAVIVEALTLLLEKRQQELSVAEAARQAAEDALGVATQSAEQARRMVEDVFQMLSTHTAGLRGDREVGTVWSKEVVGPLTTLGNLPVGAFDSQTGARATDPMVARWEFQQGQRAGSYIRRSRPWKEQVVKLLLELLNNGEKATASNLYAALEAEGVDFKGISNPVHRLTQIMSADPRFEANRAEGWGLASQDNTNNSVSPEGAAEE
jgi:hypothetical protein